MYEFENIHLSSLLFIGLDKIKTENKIFFSGKYIMFSTQSKAVNHTDGHINISLDLFDQNVNLNDQTYFIRFK
jgi:hypothetical protein